MHLINDIKVAVRQGILSAEKIKNEHIQQTKKTEKEEDKD